MVYQPPQGSDNPIPTKTPEPYVVADNLLTIGDGLAPHSVEAEEAVLGAALMDPDVWGECMYLMPDSFFIVRHIWIYAAMQEAFEKDGVFDYLSIIADMGRKGKLEDVGGAAYLLDLINKTPTSLHIAGYARIVHETAQDRNLIHAAGEIARMGHDQTIKHEDKAQLAMQAIQENVTTRTRLRPMSDAVIEARRYQLNIRLGAFKDTFVSLGYSHLHRNLGYTNETGRLILFTGMPGAYKSHMMAAFILNMAADGGPPLTDGYVDIIDSETGEPVMEQDDTPAQRPVYVTDDRGDAIYGMGAGLVVSQEMNIGSLLNRGLRSIYGVDEEALRTDSRATADRKIDAMLEKVAGLNVAWIDAAAVSIAEIEAAIQSLPRLRWIVIDSADGLSDVLSGSNDRKHERVNDALARLAALARNYDVMILATKERSRGGGYEKKTQLDNLRDGGEYKADTVISWEKGSDGFPGRTRLRGYLLKNRDGPTGDVAVFDIHNDTMRVEEMSREILTLETDNG